jgi:hypothetical protein
MHEKYYKFLQIEDKCYYYNHDQYTHISQLWLNIFCQWGSSILYSALGASNCLYAL